MFGTRAVWKRSLSPLICVLLVGCGSSPAPAPDSPRTPTPTPESAATAADKPTDSAAAAANPTRDSKTPAADESLASPTGAETKPAPANVEPLSALCNKLCDVLAPKCTKDQLLFCRVTYCGKYVPAPEGCESVVRAALECAQSQADFLLCSNVVAERCAKKFKAVQTCEKTGSAPPSEELNKTPEGWQRFEAKDAGFSALLPAQVSKKTDGPEPQWVATGTNGATYEITLKPLPAEKKFDQRAFLRIAAKLLGRCADKMKLYSIIETDDHTLIHYKTVCPDQQRQRGVYWVQGDKFFVARAIWQGQTNADADAFGYGFEVKK